MAMASSPSVNVFLFPKRRLLRRIVAIGARTVRHSGYIEWRDDMRSGAMRKTAFPLPYRTLIVHTSSILS